ncbi:MAG: K(+)-transporting ATPase subunit F [Actinomycetota bacterium]|nr:K(+)-transporting ATPase subunit F [Actinomycetota bacterium]
MVLVTSTLGGRRQDGVKRRQPRVNRGVGTDIPAETRDVIDNIVAGTIALALLAYLVYALVKPDRF